MDSQQPLEAHIAWKLKFAPYVPQPNGVLCAMDVPPIPPRMDEPEMDEPAGSIITLPVVASAIARRVQVRTQATAVLILADDSAGQPNRKPPLSARPAPVSSSQAAIQSILRLKGRFSA